jgi:Alanine-zipper, major outer membrane lipoprotein
MKRYMILSVMALSLAAGCTQLSTEDRKLLEDTHAMAQQARDQSIQATEIAKQAQASAAQSAAAAQQAQADAAKAASDADRSQKKADRIFRHGQDK